jgi:predicted DCC family thiol-disulfide oxidoreductase YuxK
MTLTPAIAVLGPEPLVVYDGECPFCSRYVRFTRLQNAIGKVTLKDARDLDDSTLAEIRKVYDLDQGMLFVYGGTVYFGADAIHAMSLLSQDSSTLGRLNAAIFRNRQVTRLLYPVLRLGRAAALAWLGRRRIHP